MNTKASELLSTSRAYCPGCRTLHRSYYEDVAGQVDYSIDCPLGRRTTRVSNNTTIFTALRGRRGIGCQPATAARKFHFYAVALTDRCNFDCPICYAESGTTGQRFLSMDELRRAALLVKASGGKRLSLSGGEPTLHPELEAMIRLVRQDVGLAPVLVTNGLRIAEEDGFLPTLQRAGLRRVHLQFDTLNNTTYRAMRGRRDVAEKHRAVKRIISAGLRLGLIATVCDLNLPEVGDLLEYAQQWVPALRILVFQPMVPTGRFPQQRQPVTREDIIRGLVQPGGKYDLDESDFCPFPTATAEAATAHPDCSAHVLMYSDGNCSRPLQTVHAAGGRASDTARDRSTAGLLSADVLPPALLRDLRQNPLQQVGGHLFFLSIIAFMRPQARDEERLERCIVASVTSDGLVPICQQGCSGTARSFAPPAPTNNSDQRAEPGGSPGRSHPHGA